MNYKPRLLEALRRGTSREIFFALRAAMDICASNGYPKITPEVLLCVTFLQNRQAVSNFFLEERPLVQMVQEICPRFGSASPFGVLRVDSSASTKFFSSVELTDEASQILWDALKIRSISGGMVSFEDVLKAMVLREEFVDRLYRDRQVRFRGVSELLGQGR
jgi:hypothetical protein